MQNNRQILLKNGTIVDGTGAKGWQGSLLIQGKRIQALTPGELSVDGEEVDCTGKVIAPGFIDAHSHNDWYLPLEDAASFIDPFIKQGITTFVGGNCGFGVVGLRKNTGHLNEIRENPFKSSRVNIEWSTLEEYSEVLAGRGLPANLAILAGHGSARSSIKGYDPAPLSRREMDEMLACLDQALQDGARGVSIGLQYQPGIFSTREELKEVARLVKQHNKILTTHARAYSALSGSYPLKPFGTAHNILAMREMIDLAKETGVRLEYSHLIFVGTKTWDTFDETMQIIDRAIADGIDIKFDLYAYTCGASVISVVLPEWFMARVPQAYDSRADLLKLKLQITLIKNLLGFGYADIQIAGIDDPQLKAFNGRFITDIARELKLSEFETYILLARSSNSKARVMQYRYTNPQLIEAMMRHPASIFITDAWVERSGAQNPASYGCFPRFLQISRETGVLSLEEAVYKMTKAAADRFALSGRGTLSAGQAADITVFDWASIRDNTSPDRMDAPPTGIEHVFINGAWVLKNGEFSERPRAGEVIC